MPETFPELWEAAKRPGPVIYAIVTLLLGAVAVVSDQIIVRVGAATLVAVTSSLLASRVQEAEYERKQHRLLRSKGTSAVRSLNSLQNALRRMQERTDERMQAYAPDDSGATIHFHSDETTSESLASMQDAVRNGIAEWIDIVPEAAALGGAREQNEVDVATLKLERDEAKNELARVKQDEETRRMLVKRLATLEAQLAQAQSELRAKDRAAAAVGLSPTPDLLTPRPTAYAGIIRTLPKVESDGNTSQLGTISDAWIVKRDFVEPPGGHIYHFDVSGLYSGYSLADFREGSWVIFNHAGEIAVSVRPVRQIVEDPSGTNRVVFEDSSLDR